MNKLKIDLGKSKGTINPNIYGHFSEHIGGVFYDGLWVGEDSSVPNIRGFRKSLVESFKKIAPPVLRWPGGCFAETYDWRDGIGPRDKRPTRVNWWYTCDGRLESNQVGTHEFMDFCNLVGAKPYFAANMTSVTPMHIRNWIEYCNFPSGTTLSDERIKNGAKEPFDIEYWGIGNENWGGGGQMEPEQYAREFLRFTAVCKPVSNENMKFIMCGPNGDDSHWTRGVMKTYFARNWHEINAYGMSIHYYNSALSGDDDFEFDTDGWYDEIFRADHIKDVLDNQRGVMDEYDTERKIKMIVDEWGNWHKPNSGPSKGYNLFEQQSSMRDAVVAALELNIFNDRCDYIDMCNLAQLCNNLHSIYLAGGDNFVETPNYHVFDMYQEHKGAKQVFAKADCGELERKGFNNIDRLSVSASVKDGRLNVTIANLDLENSIEVTPEIVGGAIASKAAVKELYYPDANACNTFEEPEKIVPVSAEKDISNGIIIKPASVTLISVELK